MSDNNTEKIMEEIPLFDIASQLELFTTALKNIEHVSSGIDCFAANREQQFIFEDVVNMATLHLHSEMAAYTKLLYKTSFNNKEKEEEIIEKRCSQNERNNDFDKSE